MQRSLLPPPESTTVDAPINSDYVALGVPEILRQDAVKLDPETAARIHLNAIHDVFTSTDPLIRRLGRERCRQFARLGTVMMSMDASSKPSRHPASGEPAPFGPLAYFSYFSWWPGEVEDLHSLFDEYADAGHFDVDTAFSFSTFSGQVAYGDNVLWYAIVHKQPELLRAAMRHGASLAIVPERFALTRGAARDDLLAWCAYLHDEQSEIFRVLTAEIMKRKLEDARQASTETHSPALPRRRAL